MTQRRTPSGQGPTRRPASSVRSTARTGARSTVTREPRAVGRTGAGSRSGSRPAAARRAAASGATRRTAAPRPRRFTGRATVLLIVLAVLALGYTYPVRVYLQQESEITRMQKAQADQRRRIAALSEEAAKWEDREYVITQVRKRFFFVRPGEVPLLVMDDPAGAAREAGRAQPAPAAPDKWYDTLFASIKAADDAPQNADVAQRPGAPQK